MKHDPDLRITALHHAEKNLHCLRHYFRVTRNRKCGNPMPTWAKNAICKSRKLLMIHNTKLNAGC